MLPGKIIHLIHSLWLNKLIPTCTKRHSAQHLYVLLESYNCQSCVYFCILLYFYLFYSILLYPYSVTSPLVLYQNNLACLWGLIKSSLPSLLSFLCMPTIRGFQGHLDKSNIFRFQQSKVTAFKSTIYHNFLNESCLVCWKDKLWNKAGYQKTQFIVPQFSSSVVKN